MRTYPLTAEQIQFAADWWSQQLDPEVEEVKRAKFHQSMLEILASETFAEELFINGEAMLATDYGAWRPLRDALVKAGFQADGLWLPWKTVMFLQEDGRVTLATQGYTAPQFRRQIYPETIEKRNS